MEPNFPGAGLFGEEEESILCVSDSLDFAVPDPSLRDPSKEDNGFAETERIESPEPYKQWHIRNTRAGFKQLPLNEELMAIFRTQLRKWYHKDFVLNEDNNWMLQGWKGRILFASSCWVSA